jgi:hypothetical protein
MSCGIGAIPTRLLSAPPRLASACVASRRCVLESTVDGMSCSMSALTSRWLPIGRGGGVGEGDSMMMMMMLRLERVVDM